MLKQVLPDSFKDLQLLADEWALPTEQERNRKRISSSMEEIQAFYMALIPRAADALEYLEPFPCSNIAATEGGLPGAERKLLELLLALAEVAPAVEVFGQPTVIGGFDSTRFIPDHDLPGWRS